MRRALVLVVVAACGKDDRGDARNVPADPSHPDPKPVAVVVDAGSASPDPTPDPRPQVKPGSPQAWFEDYRALHADATPANAVETGKKIWPMLASDAQKLVLEMAGQTVAQLGPTKVTISAGELRYKMLGETAAVRAPIMRDAKIASDDAQPELTIDGKPHVSRLLRIKGGGTTLDLPIVTEGGGWKLAAGPHITADEKEVFRAPASGKDAPVGLPTLDAVAARWKEVISSGNGWDGLNIMSPAMHQQLLDLVARMGGNGAPDVARILEKTLVDRRNRGITVKSVTIDDRTDARGSIKLTYSTGDSDTFTGVRVDGVWWLEAKL